MQNNNKRIATRFDLVVCVALACIFFVAFGLLVEETDIKPILAMYDYELTGASVDSVNV